MSSNPSRLSKIFIEAKFSNLRPFIFFIETCIPCNFNHSDIFLVEKHSSLSDIREWYDRLFIPYTSSLV
jgi:hypothetical protein